MGIFACCCSLPSILGCPELCGVKTLEPTHLDMPARDGQLLHAAALGPKVVCPPFCLTLGPIISSLEQGLAPAMFLKVLPILLGHTVPAGGVQPHASPEMGSLNGSSMLFVLKPPAVAPVLSVYTMATPPVLLPGLRNPRNMSKPECIVSVPWPGLPEAQLFRKAHPVLHTQETFPV